MLANGNAARKFRHKKGQQINGFKTGAVSCRVEDENLLTNLQSIPGKWRDHSSALLNVDFDGTFEEEEP